MASTYSNLKIQLMGTGDNSTTWGNVTNTNLGTALGEAITGSVDVPFTGADVTLTLTDTNGSQSARNLRLNLTGTTGGARNLIVPAFTGGKVYIINNSCADTITVKNATGTGVAVPSGKTTWVFNNGTNVVAATTYLTSLDLGTPLTVANGGTGATTVIAARAALSAAASGNNTDITSLSPTGSLTLTPTTGTLVGAPVGGAQGVGTINATGLFVNGVAVGTGAGSVTSINATGDTTGLTFTGGPITTSGTLTLGGTLAIANGGTGAITAAAARTALSVPSLTGTGASGTWGISITGSAASATTATTATSATTATTATNISGVAAIANGGTGAATAALAFAAIVAATADTDLTATNGSIKLINGLVLKWGRTTVTTAVDTSATITFTTPFPTACYTFVCSGSLASYSGSSDSWVIQQGTASTTSAIVYVAASANAQALTINWFAIGN